MNGEGDNYAYEDIDNDELSKVFGKDPKGRVRAIGSNVSRKQLIHLGIATEKSEQLKKVNEDEDAMKNELFSRFDSRLNNFENIMKVFCLVIFVRMLKNNFIFNGILTILIYSYRFCFIRKTRKVPHQ